MQKKVTQNKSKKAPKKGASNVAKKESIFNYDVEVPSKNNNKKLKKKVQNNKKRNDDKYIDTKEAPKISKKELEKIKKRKRNKKTRD